MLSFVWPDQTDRLARTGHALDMAAGNGLTIDPEDAASWRARRLDERRDGATHVIFHSIAWQYLPADVQSQCVRLIGKAGSAASHEAPVAWLKMEADGDPDGAAITLTAWPGGASPVGRTHVIGRADFHGRWIKWFGWPKASPQ